MSKRPHPGNGDPPSKVMAGEPADAHSETASEASTIPSTPSVMSVGHARPRAELNRLQSGDPSEIAILRDFTTNMTGPTPTLHDIFQIYPINALDSYAIILRDCILSVLYPDGDYVPEGVISEANWILVVQYLLKSRIDHVYGAYSGKRTIDRIPLVRVWIPRSLATLINGIGVKMIMNQNCAVCPQPPDPVPDPSQRISNLVTFQMLTAFSRLVTAAHQRNVITIAQLSTVTNGTGWWLLRAAQTESRATIATVMTRAITVWAQFQDWTPIDGFLAAMAVTGSTGHTLVPVWDEFSYRNDSIVDAVGIRNQYATLG